MLIRPIEAHELEAFVRITTDEAQALSILQYLQQLLEKDSVRLPWCFVAEDNGQLLGRVALWKLPKNEQPGHIILFDLPWQQSGWEAIGQQLLQEALSVARSLGVEKLRHMLDTPPQAPQWQDFYEQRRQVLESAGFVSERQTQRFELRQEGNAVTFPNGLVFRAISEVGEYAFLEALESVSADSFDQITRHDREEMGAQAEARNTYDDLRQMEYDPSWWQLAYTPEGELVGLVMPVKAPTFATIGYIGVVSEQRGRGYINLLLQQGTAILQNAGEPFIRTDTDVSNFPMANAFHRAGYTHFATRHEYILKL